MARTALYEFLTRGLVWLRIFLLGFLLPSEKYGYLVLLISAEALWGTIISYPQTKEVLFRQEGDMRHVTNALLFAVVLGPLIVLAGYFYFQSIQTAVVIYVSAILFSLSSVLQYVLRICDINLYNALKLAATILSTAVFFALLPVNANFLPVVYGSATVILFLGIFFLKPTLTEKWTEWSDIRQLINGWMIFGTQSAMSTISQYGIRFVIGASLSLASVAIYTRTYMVASGVTFLYAAVMTVHEKHLAKSTTKHELKARYPHAGQVLKHLLLSALVYFSLIGSMWWLSARLDVLEIFSQLDLYVFLVFLLYFVLQAIYLTLNPMVISINDRAISLISSVSSAALQIVFVVLFWKILDLRMISFLILLGQGVLVTILFSWLLRNHIKSNRLISGHI